MVTQWSKLSRSPAVSDVTDGSCPSMGWRRQTFSRRQKHLIMMGMTAVTCCLTETQRSTLSIKLSPCTVATMSQGHFPDNHLVQTVLDVCHSRIVLATPWVKFCDAVISQSMQWRQQQAIGHRSTHKIINTYITVSYTHLTLPTILRV